VLLVCGALAVLASRLPWVQRLDQQILGPTGVAMALWVWTAL